MEKEYDVFGMGNPLIDIVVNVDDAFLAKHGLKKGNFHLIDSVESIMESIKDMEKKQIPGDSTANTLVGIVRLGGSAVFFGKVGEDLHGAFYEEDLKTNNIKAQVSRAKLPTGKAFCFVTPDTERTFVVYLGAVLHLRKEDLCEEDVKKCRIVHLTGYQIEDPNLRETAFRLIDIAKANGMKVSFDMADPGVVERNKDLIMSLLDKVDIVFANEKEAFALTGEDPIVSANILGDICDIACVKVGPDGSYISSEGAIHYIEGVKANAIDTIGAGDMYAAAILYGLTHGLDIEEAGKLASRKAAEVVEVKGARLPSTKTQSKNVK